MSKLISKKAIGAICAILCTVAVLCTSFITPTPSVYAEEYDYNPESTPVVDLDFTGDSPTGKRGTCSEHFSTSKTNGIELYFNGGNTYRWGHIQYANSSTANCFNIPAGKYYVEYETQITSLGGLEEEDVKNSLNVQLAANVAVTSQTYNAENADKVIGEKLAFQSAKTKHKMLVELKENTTKLAIRFYNLSSSAKIAISSIKFYKAELSKLEIDFAGKKVTVNPKTQDTVDAPFVSGVGEWQLDSSTKYPADQPIPVSELVAKAVDGKVVLTPVYAYTYDLNSEPVVNLDFTGDSPTGTFGGNKAGLFDRKATDGITMYFNNGQVYRWSLIKKAKETSSASWNIPAGNYVVEYETKITSKGSLVDDAAVNDAVEVRLAYNEDLKVNGYAKDGTDTEHFLGEKLKFQTDRQKHTMLVTLTETATRLNICLFNGAAGPQLAIQSIKFYPAVSAVFQADFAGTNKIVNSNTSENIVAPESFGVTGWKLGETTYNVGDNIPIAELKKNLEGETVYVTPILSTEYINQKIDFESNFKTGGTFSGSMYSVADSPDASHGKALKWKTSWEGYERGVNFNNGGTNIALSAGKYVIRYEYKAVRDNGYNHASSYPDKWFMQFMLTDGRTPTDLSKTYSGKNLFEWSDISAVETSSYGDGKSSKWRHGAVEFTVPEGETTNNILCLNTKYIMSAIYIDNVIIYKLPSDNFEVDFAGTKQVVNRTAETEIESPAAFGVTGWVLGGTTYNVGDKIPVSELVANTVKDKVSLTPVLSSENIYQKIDFESNFKAGGSFSGGLYQVNNGHGDTAYGNSLAARSKSNDPRYIRGIVFNNGSSKLALPKGNYVIRYEYKAARDTNGWSSNADFTPYPDDYKMQFMLTDGAELSNVDFTGANIFDFEEISSIESAAYASGEQGPWKYGVVEIEVSEEAEASGKNYLYLNSAFILSTIYLDNVTIYKVPSDNIVVDFAGTQQVVNKKTETEIESPAAFGVTGWVLGGVTYNVGDKIPVSELAAKAVNEKVSLTPVLSSENIYQKIDFESNFKAGGSFSGGLYQVNNGHGDTAYGNSLAARSKSNDPTYVRGIVFNNATDKMALPVGDYVIRFEYKAVRNKNGWDSNAKFSPYPQKYNMQFILTDGSENANVAFAGINMFSFDSIADVESSAYGSNAATDWLHGTTEISVTKDDVLEGKNYLFLNSAYILSTVYIDNIIIYKNPMPKKTVNFNSNGGSECPSIRTEIGNFVDYPIPTKDGYNFAGWYSDNNTFKNKASEVGLDKDITYYAKWLKYSEGFTLDFETELKCGGEFGSGFFSYIYSGSKEYGKALLYDNNTNAVRRYTMLNQDGVSVSIEKGTRYRVSFDYYVQSLPKDGEIVMDFAINMNLKNPYNPYGTRLTNKNLLAGVSNTSTNMVGKWHRVELVCVVPEKITSGKVGILIDGHCYMAEIMFDNIKFEPLGKDDIVLEYKIPLTGQTEIMIGKKGQKIDTSLIPVLNDSRYNFEGWYTESDYSKSSEFTSEKFPSKSYTIYGKTSIKDEIHVGYDDYPKVISGAQISKSIMSISDGFSYDGDGYALCIDNIEGTQLDVKSSILFSEQKPVLVEANKSYAVTAHYYIVEKTPSAKIQFQVSKSSSNDFWINKSRLSSLVELPSIKLEGMWHSKTIVVDVPEDAGEKIALNFDMKLPKGTKLYIDDVIVQEIPEGYSALYFEMDTGVAPNPMIVKTNSTVKLPKPKNISSKKQHLGWYLNGIFTDDKEMKITGHTLLTAAVVTKKIDEGFENFKFLKDKDFGMAMIDGDWEIYNGKKNDISNVKSGSYSLHRIGKEPETQGYSLFYNKNFSDNVMKFSMKYKLSMWVKVENPVHTRGAIELQNLTVPSYTWATTGTRYSIAAIADIADGEWHKVEFTFKAEALYFAIYVPGNLSIYIDDMSLEYVDSSTAVSESVTGYEEYIPVLLNENGEYVIETKSGLSPYELVKYTGAPASNGITLVVIIIVVGAVLLLSAGVVVAVIVYKKKKLRGASK